MVTRWQLLGLVLFLAALLATGALVLNALLLAYDRGEPLPPKPR